MLEAPAAPDWEFPRSVAGVARMVAHAGTRGVPARSALAGTGLHAADLAGPGTVTAAQELGVVRNLRRLLGDAAAADVGRGYRPETFGALGFALVASRTVLDAMNVALRFNDLTYAFCRLGGEIHGDLVRVTVDGADLPADVRDFLVTRDMVAVRTVLDGLVPGGVGGRVHTQEARSVLEFHARELDRPLPPREGAAPGLAEQLCRDLVEPRRDRTGLARDVRVLITQRLPDGASMAEVAAALGWTERTLRRRLGEEGTSYRRLLDEVREPLAAELLRRGLPVADVAQRLGYAGATPFIAAHRRWTGRTPRGDLR